MNRLQPIVSNYNKLLALNSIDFEVHKDEGCHYIDLLLRIDSDWSSQGKRPHGGHQSCSLYFASSFAHEFHGRSSWKTKMYYEGLDV